jgi:NAD(P)-dependent dehydrogenase (short-subunit alcohol dehydrogenase family)
MPGRAVLTEDIQQYLITGASRGIGRAIAGKLAGKGRKLLLHGRDRSALEETAELVMLQGASARVVVADLAIESGVEAVIESVEEGPLHGLINNAGIAVVKPVAEITPAEWQQTLAINVTAPFVLCSRLLPLMPSGGTIVNILSIAAKVGFPGWSSYCMSKFAIEGFSQSIREELRPLGVRVVNIYPAATLTEMWENVSGEWSEERMLDPDEVAGAVVYALERPSDVAVESINIGNITGPM